VGATSKNEDEVKEELKHRMYHQGIAELTRNQ